MSNTLMKFIKLKSIPNYPVEHVARILAGPSYPLKNTHIDNLYHTKKNYDYNLENINTIDTFNSEKKLSNDNIVTTKFRNEKYVPDISEFTQPLLHNKISWSSNSVKSLNGFWNVCFRHNIWDHPILINDDKHYNLFPSTFKERHNIKYDYNNEIYKIIYNMNEVEPHCNFLFILRTINTFTEYNVTDFSATSVILTNHRNTLVDLCNNNIDTANSEMKKSLFYTNIYDRLSKNEKITDIFPEFNFTSVYPDSQGWWLDTMHKVVLETEDAKNWLASLDFSNNNEVGIFELASTPIGKNIMYHPKIVANGHSGSSMFETIKILNKAYKLGWKKFVKSVI
jgi:hypothetical protein